MLSQPRASLSVRGTAKGAVLLGYWSPPPTNRRPAGTTGGLSGRAHDRLEERYQVPPAACRPNADAGENRAVRGIRGVHRVADVWGNDRD
jgi:hypothetical protein